jgi:hypothetical protein
MELLLGFGTLLLLLGLLTTGVTLIYQGFIYLKYGVWTPISTAWFCADKLDVQWCAAPNDWVGVHNVLETLSPGVFLIVVAGALILLATVVEGGQK